MIPMRQIRPNNKMLELARISRGYSQKDLAEIIGIEQGTLSKIENGELAIKRELFKNIASYLKYPLSFFSEDIKILSPLVVHYRKRKSVNNFNRALIESNLYIRKYLIKKLLRSIDIPNKIFDLNPYEYESPENSARVLRQKWFVPAGPIKNLVELVESAGIFVLHLENNDSKLMGELLPDEHGVSVIYVNKDMPIDRQRYTLAHELGHLIMHSGEYVPNLEDAEKEADRFAGEFLMPELDIRHHIDYNIDLPKLGDLKRHWKCSMSSIIMRSHKLGVIDDNRKTMLFKQMSMAGFNKQEPAFGIAHESPSLVHQLLKLHLTDLDYSEEEIAEMLSLYLEEFKTINDFYSPKTINIFRNTA